MCCGDGLGLPLFLIINFLKKMKRLNYIKTTLIWREVQSDRDFILFQKKNH